MAAERVFLHIGAPKTGTTYLQHLMAANQDVLASQGVLYAAGKYPSDRVWATRVVRGKDFSDHPKSYAEGAWDRILDQVRAWDGTAVVSHEFFSACTGKQARRAIQDLAPAEVHLVFTARDYARQAAAVWQERLKYGFSAPLADFSLDATDNGTPAWSWRTQDVPAILDRWGRHLPPSHVHLVTVPLPGAGPAGALWERFASVIGTDPSTCDTRIDAANSSLGLVEAELLRRVGDRASEIMTTPQERAEWIRDLLANGVLAQGSRERFSVTPEQAADLRAHALTAVEKLGQRGYDIVGSLDDLVPPDPPPASRRPEDVSAEELLGAAVETIGGLLADAKSRDEQQSETIARLRAESRGRRRSTGRVSRRRAVLGRAKRLARRLRRGAHGA